MAKVSGVLLDVTGVLYESGGGAILGSQQAVAKLRAAGYKLRFCSNETQITRTMLAARLKSFGFQLDVEEIHSPAPACRSFLTENGLRPHLLVHPNALPDYEDLDTSSPNAVVLADAASAFTYDSLNTAFRVLTTRPGTKLISLGMGRYYKEEGQLALDVGPFTKALEYAAGAKAEVIGKPSAQFFLSALAQICVPPNEAIMIGDDVVNDVGGAQECGMMGVLVRTGKYRVGDESCSSVRPDWIVENLEQAVERLILLKQ